MKWLKFKVFMVHLLMRLKILPERWYKCESELATILGEKMWKFFQDPGYDGLFNQRRILEINKYYNGKYQNLNKGTE